VRERSSADDDTAAYAGLRLDRIGPTTMLAAVATLNLGLTFAFQWLPVATVGVGPATDALFASTIVPQVMLAVVSSSLTSVLTPMLATADRTTFSLHAWTYARGTAIAAVLLAGALFILAPWWVPWLVPGFDDETRALTVGLVRVQLIGSVATMLLMVTWAAQYARQRFLWVEVSGAIANAVGLAMGWALIPALGVAAVAWAMSIRSVLQVLLLVPGLGPYAGADWASVGGATALRRLAPLVGGATYYKLDPMLERLLASFAPPGQLSLFHLGQLAYGAGNQILTRALINPIMPRLATTAQALAWPTFAAAVYRRLWIVVVGAGAAWLAVIVAGRPSLALALHRWMTPGEIDVLHALLIGLGGVWLGGAAGQVLTVGFFAIGDTETPTRVGVAGFTIGIPIKVLFYRWWGIQGLAVAASLYTVGTAVAHLACLRRALRRRAGAERA
jgi:peptidoglycan biosynthesis protein MviN/MurJ (putative lipid II flippase)